MFTLSSPPSRPRALLRACAMVVGSGLLFWRTGANSALVVTFVTGGLLVLALVLPQAYAPVSIGLDRLQNGALRGLTWLLLSIVFVLVFVPGRLVFRSRQARFARSAKSNTYWRDVAASGASSFTRPY